MTLIKASNLKKYYTDGIGNNIIKAVDGISIEVEKGQIIAIVGPSGSGKTTLLNLLGLCILPDEGEILINGEDVSISNDKQASAIRNKMFGYIVQDYAMVEDQSAEDNIAIPLLYSKNRKLYRNRKKAIKETAQKLGIESLLKKSVKQLSGGQRQRVAIARSIINNQKIILADEPTGSLDAKTANTIMNYFADIVKSEDKTLILVTHNMELANKCNIIYTIKEGKLV